MTIIDHNPAFRIWQEAIKNAENKCDVVLKNELEDYLISMLIRYTHKPEIVKQLFGKAFLEALQVESYSRRSHLQEVGDQCLIFAGLFPKAAEKKLVKISYFVNLGQSAYSSISEVNAIFGSLAYEFVVIMDVLQSIRPWSELLPLQAYEQWNEVGSQRALRILQEYTKGIPHKSF